MMLAARQEIPIRIGKVTVEMGATGITMGTAKIIAQIMMTSTCILANVNYVHAMRHPAMPP